MTEQEWRRWALELAARVAPDAGQVIHYAERFMDYVFADGKEKQ